MGENIALRLGSAFIADVFRVHLLNLRSGGPSLSLLGADPLLFGLRGRALLQSAVLYRVQSLSTQGGVLPGVGSRPGILPGQSAEDHLRQPQGGGHQRFGPQRLFASGVPGPLRSLLSGADRLRGAGPGIERDCRGGRAVREAQCPGRPRRGAADVGGLPAIRAMVARRGGQ
jgi:hypothetical protein